MRSVVTKLSSWFYKISSGWFALLAVVIFFLFIALVLPGQSASSQSQTGDISSPDLSIYYSALDLYEMAEAYGDQGRTEYIRERFSFDLIWPLVYTFFLTTTISWLYKQSLSESNPWRRINLLPVIGMIFDYLENISTSLVMYRYPAPTLIIDWFAGFFTVLKWLLIGLSFAALVAGIIAILWFWIKKSR
jgi:hypothetical protein